MPDESSFHLKKNCYLFLEVNTDVNIVRHQNPKSEIVPRDGRLTDGLLSKIGVKGKILAK